MSKPFEIEGSDGNTLAIEGGHYYFNTKARCRRMMLKSLSSNARRVYACLELGTMGFQQELAVTMKDGEQRPLTPSDIARSTGLSKQNTRRALDELERAGLGERRTDDGGPLRNGHMRLYSWAVPRKTGTAKGSRTRLPFPDWFPEAWSSLKPLIRRLKLYVAIDEVDALNYLEKGVKAARDYEKGKEATDFIKGICAPPCPNKEEKTERTNKRTLFSSPPHADAQEGRSEPKIPSQKEDPEVKASFKDLLFAARQADMDCSAEAECTKKFLALTSKEQKAAIEGIRIRTESGDYGDPRWTPRLITYLREKQWEGTVRRDAKQRKGAGSETHEMIDDLLRSEAKGASR